MDGSMNAISVRHEEDAFDTAGGRLFERRWLPEGVVRADVAIVHGYAEHSGRYAYAGEALARRGYAVHALDLRGHGRSDGAAACVGSFREYLDDVGAFLARVRQRGQGRPLFILGHSMGGAIVALLLVVDRPAVRGAMLSGAVVTSSGMPRVVRAIYKLIGRIAPRLPLTKLKAADVSRDPDVVARYDSDPLVYRGRMRAGLVAATVRATERIDRDAPSIATPMLIMHGAADALAKPDGAKALYERIASSDKTLKLYDGLYHEILNEPEKDQVIADILAWLDARSS
jgi:alpha-beta hydrolase superfamily lysophospholipase